MTYKEATESHESNIAVRKKYYETIHQVLSKKIKLDEIWKQPSYIKASADYYIAEKDLEDLLAYIEENSIDIETEYPDFEKPSYKTFKKNPAADFIVFVGPPNPVPTKQEGFSRVTDAVQILEDGTEKKVFNLFEGTGEKTAAHVKYKESVQDNANKVFENGKLRIQKPKEVEVVISVSVNPKRYNKVDVDNLAKFLLDCLNGIAYDDDRQVSALYIEKHIHAMEVDGVIIAITEINNEKPGVVGGINLLSSL